MTTVVESESDQTNETLLPNSWQWTQTGIVARIVGGGTPPAGDATNFADEANGYPWLTPADLSGYRETYVGGGSRYLSEKGLRSSSAVIMPAETVLFTSRAPIGYVAIAARPIATNQGFRSFICREGVDPRYLRYYLIHAKPLAERFASGTTFLELSGTNAGKLPFPLPPLDEQRRIVAALDAALARLDSVAARLARVPVLLKRYRAAVLAAAVSGRLTEDWRAEHEVEPAAALLQRILVERRARWQAEQRAKHEKAGKTPPAGWQSKYQEPTAPDTDRLPELPEGWCWTVLDALLDRPMANGRSVPDGVDGFPVLRLTALRNGLVDLSQRKVGAWSFADARRYLVQRGDFLVARGNGSRALVGRGGLVLGEPDAVAFPDTVIRVRVLLSCMAAEYLRAAWDSRQVREQIENLAHTSAGIHKVTQEDLARLILPVPPLEEQREIVRRVERLLAFAEAVEARVERATAAVARTRQALLAKAFRGELVPQDPADEPASTLLARLRASGGAQAPGRRGRRGASE